MKLKPGLELGLNLQVLHYVGVVVEELLEHLLREVEVEAPELVLVLLPAGKREVVLLLPHHIQNQLAGPPLLVVAADIVVVVVVVGAVAVADIEEQYTLTALQP